MLGSNRNGIPLHLKEVKYLWIDFLVAGFGFISPVMLDYLFRSKFLPLTCGFITFCLFCYVRVNKRNNKRGCYLIPYVIARVLLYYTIISVAMLFVILSSGGFDVFFDEHFKVAQVLFFPILILAPLLAVNAFVMLRGRHRCLFCTICWIANGFPSERGYVCPFLSKEVLRVLRQVGYIGILLTVCGWGYFLTFYNTANISTYDSLIFVGLPVIMWLLHSAALGVRCLTIVLFQNSLMTETLFVVGKSYYRYLIVAENHILLKKRDDSKFDTPLSLYVNYNQRPEDDEVLGVAESNGVHADDARVLYFNYDDAYRCNMAHCILFFDHKEDVNMEGEWIDARQLEHLFAFKRLSKILRNELFRIKTTIFALKAYNADGTRKLDVKNFYPKFELSDIRNEKVDFNNYKTIITSFVNDDNKLNKLKYIWFKIFEGQAD